MDAITTFECNGRKYTVTVKPPFSGNAFAPDEMTLDPTYSVEVTDNSNKRLYLGTINALLVPQTEKQYNAPIATILETMARNVVEPTLKVRRATDR